MDRSGTSKTVADYMALPCEWGIELIDGAFYKVTPAPGPLHQTAILRLGAILDSGVRARDLGKVFITPFDVVLSRRTVVQPDVLFIAAARLDRLGERLEGPPDIAIEFLSKYHRDHDLKRKKALYLRHKMQEYWIGDPVAKTLLILERVGSRWRQRVLAKPGDIVGSPLLPGVAIPVSEIYA
jgi:Uma2 family endonuclease